MWCHKMKTLKIQSHFPYSTSIQTCYDITVYVQEKPTSTYDTKQSIDHSEENMWVPISWLFRSLPEHVHVTHWSWNCQRGQIMGHMLGMDIDLINNT